MSPLSINYKFVLINTGREQLHQREILSGFLHLMALPPVVKGPFQLHDAPSMSPQDDRWNLFRFSGPTSKFRVSVYRPRIIAVLCQRFHRELGRVGDGGAWDGGRPCSRHEPLCRSRDITVRSWSRFAISLSLKSKTVFHGS